MLRPSYLILIVLCSFSLLEVPAQRGFLGCGHHLDFLGDQTGKLVNSMV